MPNYNVKLPEFDEKLLRDINMSAKSYDVTYYLFKTNKIPRNVTLKYIDALKKKRKVENAACFSSIRYHIDKDFNTLVYCLSDINITDMSYLTTKEVRRWLRLCKKYGFIDKDISIKFGVKHPYVIIRFDKYTKNQLYVYICSIRYLVEWPHYVRFVLTLYDAGLPFYSAFVAASRLVINNDVHHILTALRYYGERFSNHKEIFSAKIIVYNLIGLKLFLSDFRKHENKDVYTGSFDCSYKILNIGNAHKIANIEEYVEVKDLFTNELKALAKANNLDDMKKYLQLFNENRKNYNFIFPGKSKKEVSNA